jgi:hypothetical protein
MPPVVSRTGNDQATSQRNGSFRAHDLRVRPPCQRGRQRRAAGELPPKAPATSRWHTASFVTMIVAMTSSRPIARALSVLLTLTIGTPVHAQHPPHTATPSLDEKLGQMLMVGFRGHVATADSSIARNIRDLHLGSVILFDVDVERGTPDRNIASPAQLKALVDSLQSFAHLPLFIAIDQEGGRVNRLKTTYGFPASVSAHYPGMVARGTIRTSAWRTSRTHGASTNWPPTAPPSGREHSMPS